LLLPSAAGGEIARGISTVCVGGSEDAAFVFEFAATVSSRSSRKPGGPPGEAEILTLNPQRRVMLLRVTGWTDLIAGTLNLEVAEDVVRRLSMYKPAVCEDAADVVYPEPYAHIPRLRGGYLYYFASIGSYDAIASALIRRAQQNPLARRIEAFSNLNLREALSLSDGDVVDCRVTDEPR